MDHDDDLDPASARVRDELARLGEDAASAPEVPAAVTARVGGALRAAGAAPAHSVRRPRLARMQVLALVIGACAAVTGVVIGVAVLAHEPPPRRDAGPTARSITVSAPTRDLPLSDAEILALLNQPADYGPLADAARRASCLAGLGYPAVTPLGARPVDLHGRSGVLMLLPGDTAQAVVALMVQPDCTAADSGVMASTVLTRP